ncbi:MAG: HD domain-containing protein [Spirochaetales bacterium]|nr:HD domain-containing protein [Spirochaetales bacterium]
MLINEEFKKYVERTSRIRSLSSPSIGDFDNADDYALKLHKNFETIGKLAKENREFLNNFFYPYLDKTSKLETSEINQLVSFSDSLINPEAGECLDLPIVSIITDKLASLASEEGNIYQEIKEKDVQIGVIYDLMIITKRLTSYPEISEHYRDLGFKISEFYFDLLKKEKFEKIEDEECREIIVTNTRFSIAFYEGIKNNPNKNKEQIEKLLHMLELADDPFYQKLIPNYEWRYHKYRALQYLSMSTDKQNAAGFSKEQILLIYKKTQELSDLFISNKDYFAEILQGGESEAFCEFFLIHNKFFAGLIDKEAYEKALINIYNKCDKKDYRAGAGYLNLHIPLELFLLIDKKHYSMKDQNLIQTIYKNLLSYAFHMPNGESISSMLEYYCDIIDEFIEDPSGYTCEQMMLQYLAAFHPPTYVHSIMVGLITECLCRHLLNQMPEKLIGVLDCKSVDNIKEKYDEILNLAYHSACCHDFGKTTIIDTIFVYGRRLLDMEFDLIKTHPKTGYNLLKKYASTRQYAEVALGHHKWYDNSRGYPEDFDTSKSSLKPIIDLVLCADCLDAATDTVGRSYNSGKKLDDFIKELKEGSGTRYAPWLSELIKIPEVYSDIQYILTSRRKQTYRETFYLLRDMQERDI